ncbi:MAG: TnsA endonuclease N-terminal domain-containing protein [Candidatus Hodarchaeales archaeon]
MDHLVESRKGESLLEMRLNVLQEHEKKVLAYDYQAVPENKKGKFEKLSYLTKDNVQEEWTPDVAVIWSHREPWIIEVKTLKEIRDNYDKLSNKFKQAEEWARKNGWTLISVVY